MPLVEDRVRNRLDQLSGRTGVEVVAEAMRFASKAGEKIDALAAMLGANSDLSPSGRVSKFRQQESKLLEPAAAKLHAANALIESKMKDSELQMRMPAPPQDGDGLRR